MTQGKNTSIDTLNNYPIMKLVVIVSLIAVFIIGSLTLFESVLGISLNVFRLEVQPMRLVSSILMVMSSTSLWFFLFVKKSSWSTSFLRTTGILIIVISAITLLTFYLGPESNLDNYILLEFFLHPDNKMAMFTAFIFLCMGFIFILFSSGSKAQDDIAHILFFPSASISYFVLVSYLLQVQTIFMVKGIYTALETAFSLFLLCLVVLFMAPGTWLMRILSGQGPGSIMGRRLLPWILVVPVLISWMRITADREEYFSHGSGAILAAIIYTLSFLFLVWYSALFVNKLDETRKQAFEALHESQSRLNALRYATTDVVYVMSPDWKQMKSLKGGDFFTSFEKPMDNWLNNFIPQNVQPLVLAEIQKAIDTKSKYEMEHQVIGADGSVGWIFSRAIPLLNDNGEIEEWMGIAENITELKKARDELIIRERVEAMRIGAESALIKLNEELMRSNKELQQFAYLTSHDLQEPLRTISIFSERLSRKYKGHFDEEGERTLHYIIQASKRLKKLISDLLTYSLVGSSNTEFVEVDFNEVFKNVVHDLDIIIKKKKAIVTSDYLPKVSGDETQLFQLLRNLVDNSLKFSKKTPEIHVSAKEVPGYHQFSVKDNGIGIDHKYSEKIFLIFQRMVGRSEYDGTGIGLAICKRIAERHGGSMSFESKINEGSTFYFTIAR